jgi:hypothetical protein
MKQAFIDKQFRSGSLILIDQANDIAIRHGCYFLLFGKVEGKSHSNSNQTVG